VAARSLPSIFLGTAAQVISSTVLHAAGAWLGSENGPMIGVRESAGYAREYAWNGDAARRCDLRWTVEPRRSQGAALRLTVLGLALAQGASVTLADAGQPHICGLIDWLAGWLEDCGGGEFGAVAGTLARIPGAKEPPKQPKCVARFRSRLRPTVSSTSSDVVRGVCLEIRARLEARH
jgi:hypothetical protein